MDERIFLVASINIRGRSLWSNGVAPFNILKCLEIHFLEEFLKNYQESKNRPASDWQKLSWCLFAYCTSLGLRIFFEFPGAMNHLFFCSYLFLIQSEEEGKVTSLFDNDSIFVYTFETKDNEFILPRSINQWGT